MESTHTIYIRALNFHDWSLAIALLVIELENGTLFTSLVNITDEDEAFAITREIEWGIRNAFHDPGCSDHLCAPIAGTGGLWVSSLIKIEEALRLGLPECDMPRELELEWEEWELRGH